MNSLKLAVIGAGLIGQRHLELVHASAECQVSAICDPNPVAATIAAQYDVPFYQDYRTLLQESASDGAIIATPTDLHMEIGIACAERCIHMLVEKPITATVADAQKLIDAADRHGVQILVGHHRRHNSLVQNARRIVQSGQLGRLTAVSAHFLLKKPDDYYGMAWRTLRPGGGPALINVIHDIDNLRYICGDVQQVFAMMSSATRGFAVEDALSVSLTFVNGALGSILGADTTPSPWSYELTSGENSIYPHYGGNCYHFCGTKGSLAFPQMRLWRYADPARAGWHEPLEQSTLSETEVPLEALPKQSGPLVAQIAHFCRVIREVEAPLVNGPDAAKSLAVVLAILESAEAGIPVRL